MSGTGTADRTTEEGLLFIAPMAPLGVYRTLDAKSHGAVAVVYVVTTLLNQGGRIPSRSDGR